MQNAYVEIAKRSTAVGIFRTSPNQTELERAVQELDKNHNASLQHLPTEVVSALIKLFVRKIQPSLLNETLMKSLNGVKEV